MSTSEVEVSDGQRNGVLDVRQLFGKHGVNLVNRFAKRRIETVRRSACDVQNILAPGSAANVSSPQKWGQKSR